jgi:predicted TPR repeat methyltransferase
MEALLTDKHRFDSQYYQRFYHDPDSRVITKNEFSRLGNFVCAYARYIDQPVHRVLDLGCGIGLWRAAIKKHFPEAEYTGVELSDYLCKKYGWQAGSVVDFRSHHKFDLVICQDVLQYLKRNQAEQAIDNLARLTKGMLYFGCLTKEDWEHNCDQSRTDGNGYLRRGRWYRQRLGAHFTNAGGGVYLLKAAGHIMFDLETLP